MPGLALLYVQEAFGPVDVFETKTTQLPGTYGEPCEECNEGTVANASILIRLAGFQGEIDKWAHVAAIRLLCCRRDAANIGKMLFESA